MEFSPKVLVGPLFLRLTSDFGKIPPLSFGCIGQPMSIAYDTSAPPPSRLRARRAASDPTSLLNRIQKRPLVDRLSNGDESIKVPTGP
jgi:hypothetical protein